MDLKFNMRSYMGKEPEMSSDVVLVALDDASKIDSLELIKNEASLTRLIW